MPLLSSILRDMSPQLALVTICCMSQIKLFCMWGLRSLTRLSCLIGIASKVKEVLAKWFGEMLMGRWLVLVGLAFISLSLDVSLTSSTSCWRRPDPRNCFICTGYMSLIITRNRRKPTYEPWCSPTLVSNLFIADYYPVYQKIWCIHFAEFLTELYNDQNKLFPLLLEK